MALHHAAPSEVVDLSPLADKLKGSKTNAIARTASFEVIRLMVPAGKTIPAHEVPGEITLHCLEGHAEIELDDATVELQAGHWIYLEGGKRHAVKGIDDTSILLTILFPQ